MVEWQVATVRGVRVETPRVKTFHLYVPEFGKFRAGQHVDIRLTAPDGYQAQRSYSMATAPDDSGDFDITVELIEDGEVSPYFHEVVQEGDQFELRGPVGGPFTWTERMGGPLLLVGGGSGVVPLMSVLRHRTLTSKESVRTALLYSSRSLDEVIYRKELEALSSDDSLFDLTLTLTREQASDWKGHKRRVDADLLQEVIRKTGTPAVSYVCGPTGFVESVASLLVDSGLPPESIRTERFGPSGS